MMKNLVNFFFLISVFSGVLCQQPRYHGVFQLKYFGKLPSTDYQTIFTAEGPTFGKTFNNCSKFCANDQRCIGIEICQIRQDLFECRVCCEWTKVGTNNIDEHPGCKYLEMEINNRINFAVNATLSTVFDSNHMASNAVDGMSTCQIGSIPARIAHSKSERNPWLKIGLRNSVNVKKVLIYNRQDCCGERLQNVVVNVTESGQNHPCGFYPGPAETGDRILFLCESGTRGNDVTISILSNEQPAILALCEVEVYD